MKLRFLNKTIENQKFRYTPRYYDERKAKLSQKIDQYKKLESGMISAKERKEILKDNIHQNWSSAHNRQSQNRTSNIRIIILILLIVALGYFIFGGLEKIDTVIKKLW